MTESQQTIKSAMDLWSDIESRVRRLAPNQTDAWVYMVTCRIMTQAIGLDAKGTPNE